MDQQKMRRQELSRKSVPYQVVKYILLLLNIMIVSSTAIVTVIICLLPTIIYEKKLSVESALNFFETGTFMNEKTDRTKLSSSSSRSFDQQEADLVKLSSQEVETIRIIRFVILGLSAGVILNQTVAVYGLFRERTCYILLSSTFIGLVGQLSLFVLPATIFLLIVLYLTFSITFVVLLHHLDSLAKLGPQMGRSVSRASSLEPFGKTCCCRCRGCLCSSMTFGGGPPQPQPMPTATINANRKTSIPYSQQQQTAPLNHVVNPVPYYYGSLGRKSRESRMYLSQLQAMKPETGMPNDPYGQQRSRLNSNAMGTGTQLKPSNKFANLSVENSFKSPYGTVRRESAGYNYANLDRFNNSTMI